MVQVMRVGQALATLVGVGLLVSVSACAPIVEVHGYAPLPEELETIVPGQDTRGSVRRKIGRPGGSGVFTDEGWFYVSTRTEQRTYKAPEVTDRRVVAVLFDRRDIVTSVNSLGIEDGRLIDLETETTPTLGRELTIIEQALGNIGLVNAEDFTTN